MGGMIEAPFGGEIRRFRLDIGAAEELEEKYDRGCGRIMELIAQEQRIGMLRDVLRRGLVGGGTDEVKARILVDKHASTGVALHINLAVNMIGRILIGDPDEPPGKSEPGPEASCNDPGATDERASDHSTEPER